MISPDDLYYLLHEDNSRFKPPMWPIVLFMGLILILWTYVVHYLDCQNLEVRYLLDIWRCV